VKEICQRTATRFGVSSATERAREKKKEEKASDRRERDWLTAASNGRERKRGIMSPEEEI